MISKIKKIVMGDIHLGHPNTPTLHIIATLESIFRDTTENQDLDMVILEGDVFDRQLQVPDEEVYQIRLWIARFLQWAKRNDIVVRVLEGTPSHDWKQSRLFTHINELAGIGADVKHITRLSIERIERFDATFLYIPDEWKPTCEETWADVKRLLANEGLESVDFTVMHGMFPHQMPKNVRSKMDMHDPENYLSITNRYVYIGHVHTQSQYQRILAAGSVERLAHGEERSKGYYRVVVRDNGQDDIVFVENKHAKRYVTVDCVGLSLEEARDKVDHAIKRLPNESHVRVRCRKNDAALAVFARMRDEYPTHRWTMKIVGKDEEETIAMVDNRRLLKTININRENIAPMLLERVAKRNVAMVERCERLLREMLS